MSPHTAARDAWHGVHGQGEHEGQHFAGLRLHVGYSVLCSALGGKPSTQGLLHLPAHTVSQPGDDTLLHARTISGIFIKHL